MSDKTEARLVSYSPYGYSCTLNINGEEVYFDKADQKLEDAYNQGLRDAAEIATELAHNYIGDVGYSACHDLAKAIRDKIK